MLEAASVGVRLRRGLQQVLGPLGCHQQAQRDRYLPMVVTQVLLREQAISPVVTIVQDD